MRTCHEVERPAGFSLVEMMVALVVMSVGLLGIAKMQAVALSNTTVASTRALAAIEASSLAASMHVNRGYWGSGIVAAKITIQGTTVTGLNTAGIDCTVASCPPQNLAAYDLQQWANAAQKVLPPDYLTTITCAPGDSPPDCTVQIQWSERSVALNNNGQAQADSSTIAINTPVYQLYVEP
jgi:type IV pilus assembly protein PilV